MTVMVSTTYQLPPFSVADVTRLLAPWGRRGTATELPSERDRNFHVRFNDGGEAVLKVSNRLESRQALELQHAALRHCAQRSAVALPLVIPALDFEDVVDVSDGRGGSYLTRLLAWVPGTPLAVTRPHTDQLMASLGTALGSLDAALLSFAHPAARRAFKWDLVQATWAVPFVNRVADASRRRLATDALQAFTGRIAPLLRTTRTAVIYGDANDYNILTRPGDGGDLRGVTVAGFIDFGDLVESHLVCDLAVALAYAMLHKADPLTAAVEVVRGFHQACPLTEDEVALLMPLARTRLAVSAVNAALQLETSPGHDYLQISAEPAWTLLSQLAVIDDSYAECLLRSACGWEPSPRAPAVRSWLTTHRGQFAPLVDVSLDGTDVPVFDLSVASRELGPNDEWQDLECLTTALFERLQRRHAQAAIGRYDEVRALYTSDVFRVEGNHGPEFRSIHVGLDVFMRPGSPVYAPLAGRIHSFQDNAKALDYGPTIILAHDVEGPSGSLTFYSLYGHLTRASLGSLVEGQPVAAGEKLAEIGEAEVNGGWPPHLHFQLICDLFGRRGDFPGVARPRERVAWLSACPDPSLMVALPATARAPRSPSQVELLERRQRHIGKSLSLSYKRPLHIVRGSGSYLIDIEGRRYLDAVNNVAHVGHAHPRVVRAGQRQMQVLNTNTRYLHEDLVRYAERLTATLPPPLSVVYFVCSGSEANELAIRLARAYTGERDMVVLEAGYHGNTSTLIDVSSYKFDGPGGHGAPDWVHVVPMPDDYRGPFRRGTPHLGTMYAQSVREAVAEILRRGKRPAAFLCESILSCGGQIVLPPGYLSEAYRHIRDAGGICIADEVQVGFGRVGSHFWAFETQEVVPDVVTMGKPIGNGHPLGAVVTTPEIATAFANGMEYFNTFGGNPVSCAIGLSVLDVIAEEGLQERALTVGGHLGRGLRELQQRFPLLGDVRGLGLFVGVELVEDQQRLVPATRQASYVANRMREGGVLMSTDGPFNNVLKIKPPLSFSTADADLLVERMADALLDIETSWQRPE